MSSVGLLKATQFVTLAVNNTETMSGRIFGMDAQLLADVALLALSMFVLFILLSYLLFNPARKLMQSRRDKIQNEMEFSAKEKETAIELKQEYTEKLKQSDKEVDEILSSARKKALKREENIVDEAKQEAVRIIERANKEAELEKDKVKDEVKKEIIDVASFMAGRIISESIDPEKQTQLIEETLSEMGDDTWER